MLFGFCLLGGTGVGYCVFWQSEGVCHTKLKICTPFLALFENKVATFIKFIPHYIQPFSLVRGVGVGG